MFVSDETLAQIFVDTTAEMEFQVQLEVAGQVAPPWRILLYSTDIGIIIN
jgi:hypothetical protein